MPVDGDISGNRTCAADPAADDERGRDFPRRENGAVMRSKTRARVDAAAGGFYARAMSRDRTASDAMLVKFSAPAVRAAAELRKR